MLKKLVSDIETNSQRLMFGDPPQLTRLTHCIRELVMVQYESFRMFNTFFNHTNIETRI